MSPIRTTWSRTVGRALNSRLTGGIVAGFLAACAARLAVALQEASGTSAGLVAVWTTAVAPVVPVLASFLAMDVWSDERYSGRIDVLLSTPVREREYAIGKLLGVWTLTLAGIVIFLTASIVSLRFFAPAALLGIGATTFIPAFASLGLQSVLWCAVAVAVSAMTRHSALAAAVSVALLLAVPRGIWYALTRWLPSVSSLLGEMPIDSHAVDMASGVVSTGTVLSYLALAAGALFVASKRIALLRCEGRGGRKVRVSTGFAVLLAVVFVGLLVTLFRRFDCVLDLPVGHGEMAFSARTRNVLSEARGEIVATAFLPRSDAQFRTVSRFLHALQREATARAGVRLRLRFTDPRWDLGDAERLTRAGMTSPSVVFSRGRRMVELPISDGVGERAAIGAILQLTMPPQRRNVYWTYGHGEAAFDAYGPAGLSDIARELSRDGYRNRQIDFCMETQVPSDCALIVIAGAREDFSRVEIGRIDAYLRQGGRLLVLMDQAASGGVAPMLPVWGLLPDGRGAVAGERTLTGSDVVVSDFADHPVSTPLDGSQIVLDRPLSFRPSAAADQGGGADRIEFSALARSGARAFAAVVERGARVGEDTAIRPMRIIAIGDSGFVTNAHLTERANANRDFFLNCVAYLSGSHAVVSGGPDGDVLALGMDAADRRLLHATLAVFLPLAVGAVFFLIAARRRRRG